MAKQENIEVIAINLPAGEEELLVAGAHYFADRLLKPKQQKAITLRIEVSNTPIRVPLTRDMLSESPGVFGASLPSVFEMSVSTAAGIKDALEVIAHEIVHVSQVLNRRLRMRPCQVKSGKVKHMSHAVSWLGDKFPSMDELAWHLRPWEIEACQWQTILVNEFIERMTGKNMPIVTQRGRNNQLALLNVRPSAIKAPPQSPSLSPVKATNEPTLPIFEANQPVSRPDDKAVFISEENDASTAESEIHKTEDTKNIDNNNAKVTDETSIHKAKSVSDSIDKNADDKIIQTSRPVYKVVGGMMNGHQNGYQGNALNGDAEGQYNGEARAASNDGENTAIQIRINGLETPRLLSRGALSSKLDDLLARGLITPEDAEAAQTSLTKTDD